MWTVSPSHAYDRSCLELTCKSCGAPYNTSPCKEYARHWAAKRKGIQDSENPTGTCKKCMATARAVKQRATLIARYGVTNVSQLSVVKTRKKATTLKNYGVLHTMQSPELREAQRRTVQERYGRDNVFQGPEGKKMAEEGALRSLGRSNVFQGPEGVAIAQQGMHRRHGVVSPMQVPEFKNKQADAVERSLGVRNPFQAEPIKAICRAAYRGYRDSARCQEAVLANQTNMLSARLPPGWGFVSPEIAATHYEVICPACSSAWRVHKSNPWTLLYPGRVTCPSCAPMSRVEDAVEALLPDGGQWERKNRLILSPENMAAVGMPKVKNGLELDYYSAKHRLAIEINGLYYHSFDMLSATHPHWTPVEVRKYHWYKTKACERQGIKLITLWEDEISPRLRGFLRHACGDHAGADKIGARELALIEVEAQEAAGFYEINHLQGGCRGGLTLGLRDNLGGLRACMTFGDPRHNRSKAGGLLLQRFATQGSVPGAASRLLAQAQGHDEIISYSDNRYSNGSLYRRLGFTLVSDAGPDYSYTKGLKRFPKNKLQLPVLRRQAADKGLQTLGTEAELAEALGYTRVYDCGKKTWVLPVINPNS